MRLVKRSRIRHVLCTVRLWGPGLLAAVLLAPVLLAGPAAASALTAGPAGAAASCCTVTVNGPSVPMKITTPGKTAARTFHGTAGQRVSAVVTNVVTSDQGCETLTLLDPGGAAVTSSSACGNGNPISLGPVNLAKTGTYTVRFEADNTATGHGSLKVST